MQDILNKLNGEIKNINNLTFDDLEGLIDGPDDVEIYQENMIVNVIEDTAKLLNWTVEEVEDWYSKNWS